LLVVRLNGPHAIGIATDQHTTEGSEEDGSHETSLGCSLAGGGGFGRLGDVCRRGSNGLCPGPRGDLEKGGLLLSLSM
jgi:hypothetical protein